MNIYAKPGSKVKYLDENGYAVDVEIARKDGLKKGEIYEVERTEVGQSHSSVWLKGFKGGFNTVMFEDVDAERARGSE